MRDALLLVDVINAFDHEDGERLLESFRERHHGLVRALERERMERISLEYVENVVGMRLERAAA